ncbi:MAG: hypothetical protein PHV95_00235 [Eubacteriales bacterium]|nr:hypothetical protein [Eubacteriales bacterium]
MTIPVSAREIEDKYRALMIEAVQRRSDREMKRLGLPTSPADLSAYAPPHGGYIQN